MQQYLHRITFPSHHFLTSIRAPPRASLLPIPAEFADMTPDGAGTSQLGQAGETGAADVDSEETEDDCAAGDMEIDDDSDDHDFFAHVTTASSLSTTLGCLGKQEPCDEDGGNESASLTSSPTAAEHVVTNPTAPEDVVTNPTTAENVASNPTAAENVDTDGHAPIKTENGTVPCTTFGSPPSATSSGLASSSSAVNGDEAESPDAVSPTSGVAITAPSAVKTEAHSSVAGASVSRETPTIRATSPTTNSFSHQLFSSCKMAWWELVA